MRKTNTGSAEKLVVDINGLQDMLSIGKNKAYKIGEEAGAIVPIGRRKLYNVKKIEQYIDGLTGV